MSHVDPYRGGAEPRGRQQRPEHPRGLDRSRGPERQDGPAGRQWPAGDDDAWVRARHGGAAPDTYAAPTDSFPVLPDTSAGPTGQHPAPPDIPVDPDGGYPATGFPPGKAPGLRSGTLPGHRNGHRDQAVGDPGSQWRGAEPGGPATEYPAAGRPGYPEGGDSPYPDGDDRRGADASAEAPTNPVGWPFVDPDPAPEPSSAPRRGPGRRRATRSGQPAASGRAGRNLPAAIGVGLGLGAAIVVPLFLFRPAFLVVVAIAVSIGIWEMTQAVRPSGVHPPLVPLIAGGLLMVGLAWWAGPDALSLGLLVTVLATLVWRLGDGPAGYQRDMTAATLIAVYVPFLGGFAALLAAAPDDGELRVLVTLAAVVLSDTGGYAAGVAFGKHPMAPSVSPKKSWEGFAGSVAAAAIGSAVLLGVLLDVEPWWGAIFGVAVSVAAVLGDLGESMIKRDLGVKDMSNLLPGHGGLMDRLDSVLFAVPTGYLLLAIFAPTG
ncbi:phosphatidate cytidylyltransferase [Plantactinospora soyae]|uniref:Phosphatidate cytidylyltransferase n=1 Tax=Plantactinospora soyae TaxID=1544732 RepID=A0A927M6X7_9ACTN|nr:phosphatidate cytidylyltransferase [Plantactinospora soyae]MBE1487856.1 phosphatidate cytidylyltransferase [Plantactinospora soyae]